MTRRIAWIVAFAIAGTAPALAQTQVPPHPRHPQGQPHHPPSHPPMDPELHAALHGKLVGDWAGSLKAADGRTTNLRLQVTSNKEGQLTVSAGGHDAGHHAVPNQASLDAQGFHWMHALAGSHCRATANLQATTHHSAETLKGSMICGGQELPFTLDKVKK